MDITECDHNSELLVTDGCFPKFPWKSSSSTEKKPQPIPDRTSLYYPMASSPRGRCLILNYDNFNILQNNAPRKGSTVDVHELKNTFSELRFDVVVHHNLSMKGTKDLLERESKFDHTSHDCFVLCILTHGGVNDVIFCTDGPLVIDEDVISQLTPSKCPSLVGKPKLIFIQACRGQDIDEGVLVQDSPGFEPSFSDAIEAGPPRNPFRLPSHADFLIFYSAYAGQYSWRNPTNGSWFIQDLCHILNSYSGALDLMTMLTLVCKEVAFNRQSNRPSQPVMHQRKVMPCFLSTLTRVVRFGPVPQ